MVAESFECSHARSLLCCAERQDASLASCQRSWEEGHFSENLALQGLWRDTWWVKASSLTVDLGLLLYSIICNTALHILVTLGTSTTLPNVSKSVNMFAGKLHESNEVLVCGGIENMSLTRRLWPISVRWTAIIWLSPCITRCNDLHAHVRQ